MFNRDTKEGVVVFLDLEGVCIDRASTDFNNCSILIENLSRIKSFLKTEDEVQLFSFAIWDESDRLSFSNSGLKASLEKSIEHKIEIVPTRNEIKAIVSRFKHLRLDDVDFSAIFDKHSAFMAFILASDIENAILIDDTVPDSFMIFNVERGTVKIQTINIESL